MGDGGVTPFYDRDGVTIYCGEAIKIMRYLDNASIDMIFTDPPYGHNNNNGDLISRWEAALGVGDYVPDRDNRPIDNDGIEANELFKDSLPEFKRLLKPGCCCCCCCCCGGPDPQFARWSLWMDEILEFKHMVVWDKGPMGMGWHYRRSYETILIAQRQGAACAWFDDTKKVENIIRPGDGIKKIIPTDEQHPTEKPIQLPTKFILLHSLPGWLVLDPFMGSGTTLVAAQNEGRRAVGIEISEEYCKIAVDRLRQKSLFSIIKPEPKQQEDKQLKLADDN